MTTTSKSMCRSQRISAVRVFSTFDRLHHGDTTTRSAGSRHGAAVQIRIKESQAPSLVNARQRPGAADDSVPAGATSSGQPRAGSIRRQMTHEERGYSGVHGGVVQGCAGGKPLGRESSLRPGGRCCRKRSAAANGLALSSWSCATSVGTVTRGPLLAASNCCISRPSCASMRRCMAARSSSEMPNTCANMRV